MLEFLVVDGPEVDVGLQLFAGRARRQALLALVVEAVLDQLLAHVLHLCNRQKTNWCWFSLWNRVGVPWSHRRRGRNGTCP